MGNRENLMGDREQGSALTTSPLFTQNWTNISTSDLHQSIALDEYSRLVS